MNNDQNIVYHVNKPQEYITNNFCVELKEGTLSEILNIMSKFPGYNPDDVEIISNGSSDYEPSDYEPVLSYEWKTKNENYQEELVKYNNDKEEYIKSELNRRAREHLTDLQLEVKSKSKKLNSLKRLILKIEELQCNGSNPELLQMLESKLSNAKK